MPRPATIALLLVLPAVGCGADNGGSADPRARGKTLTIYAGVPTRGPEATAGRAAIDGMRAALAAAKGRAGKYRVRLVAEPTTRDKDDTWDPGTVKSAADDAVDDPSTIAYIGELDPGASAVSLPITNREGILQISPSDTLTSLTHQPPGRPRAGPVRYYPDERRSFARLVRPDVVVARRLLRAAKRPIAIVTTTGIAERELAAMIASLSRRRGHEPVAEELLRDHVSDAEDVAEEVASEAPASVILAVNRDKTTAPLIDSLRRLAPQAALLGGPGLARPGPGPAATFPVETTRPAGLERRYGQAAMEVVLAAIKKGGRDRRAVVRAAISPRRVNTRAGTVTIVRGGDGEFVP